jgi:hypothetical protein
MVRSMREGVVRLPGIDRKVARAVNGAIEKDVKKRLGIAEFSVALS